MAQPSPMSTPIFDELLREFASRMEENRDREDSPAVPQPTPGAASNRHRAD